MHHMPGQVRERGEFRKGLTDILAHSVVPVQLAAQAPMNFMGKLCQGLLNSLSTSYHKNKKRHYTGDRQNCRCTRAKVVVDPPQPPNVIKLMGKQKR